MEKYFVMVAGGGETSRANLEALMEDHYYANGPDGTLVIPYIDKPSQSQIFAAQYAKDKNKDIIAVSNAATGFDGLPAGSFVTDPSPYNAAVEILRGQKSSAFLLWLDEDVSSQNILAACSEAKIPAFDLLDGLTKITPSKGLKEKQEVLFPESELDIPNAEESEEDDDDEEEEEDEEEEYGDEDEQVLDDLYNGVVALARIFAQAIVAEMKKDTQE